MIRKAAAALLALACQAAPSTPGRVVSDPEAAAAELLSPVLFAPSEAVRARFLPELDAADFPLRLMANGPEDLRSARLDRLRLIDGRAVVTVRATLQGAVQVFDFWMERREGVWLVAGWEGTPAVLPVPDAPVPPAAPDPPVALLGPVFRLAQPVPTMPLPISAAAPAPETAAIEVHFKPPAVAGACTAAEVSAATRHAAAALKACYLDALAGAPPRHGRLTFELEFLAGRDSTRASLKETTLLLPGLGDCMTAAMGAVRLADRTCLATVPVTVSPPFARP